MKILRYAISEHGRTKMPKGDILRVDYAAGGVFAWVLAEENAPLVDRDLRIFAAQEETPSNGWYRGSFEMTNAVSMERMPYFVYEWLVTPP